MLKGFIARAGIIGILVVSVAILSVLSPHFLTVNNLTNILLQVAITTIIGVGMTFVIMTGGIDLSVGSIVALSIVVMAVVHKALAPMDFGILQWLVVIVLPMLLALVTGTLTGLINGVMVAKARVPAFIMTLGMMSMARGGAYIVSDNQTISVFPEGLTFLGDGRVFGIPMLIIASLVIVAIAAWVLGRTIYGRFVYALGGNRLALRLSGVNAARVEMSVYAISGLACGVASIALLGRLNVAQPVAGFGYELDAIAAVIIGGTSIFGGEGKVANTLLGALLVGIIRNRLNLLNVSPNVQLVAIGAIIVLAVFFDKLRFGPRLTRTGKAAPPRRDAATTKEEEMHRRLFLGAAAAMLMSVPAMAADAPVIAYVVKEINPYFNVMLAGAEAEAQKLGVELKTSAAASQTAVRQQMGIVEDFISQNVDAIVIAPIDSKALVPVVARAIKAGIKVVNVDNRLDADTMKAAGIEVPYVGVNDEVSAYNAAKAIVDKLGGTGKVAILEGIRGADNAQARKRGAEKAFAEAPGIEIVASQTANWQAEEALNVMTNIIQANPDINGVFAANDMMSFGVIQAIAAAGKEGKVVIASIDAEDQAKANIKEGKALATVYQNQDAQAAKAVSVALEMINGATVDPDIQVDTILLTAEDL